MNQKLSSLADLLRALGAAPHAASSLEEEVYTAYRRNDLPYHNLNHIYDTLFFLHRWQTLAADPQAVALGLWFHDIIYDVQADDNEARSSAFARQKLAPLRLDEKLLDEVERLILLTKLHQAAAGDKNGGLIADADLAVLASPPAQYDAYAEAIRMEYAFLPDSVFDKGRAAVLQRFLARRRIYHHQPIHDELEAAARSNLGRELRALTRS